MPKEPEVREPLYSAIHVRLPTFAVLILRQRAKDRNLSVSAVIEPVILDDILMDELQAMAEQSPDFATIAEDWLRWAITVKRSRGTKRTRRSEP